MTVVLFPGQGSQDRSMGQLVADELPGLHDRACRELGHDVFERAEESTRFLQPAVYCASLAGWSRLRRNRPELQVQAMAGHSLGELAALAAAQVFDVEDGLRLVIARGAIMDELATGKARGGMLAVLGPTAHDASRSAELFELAIANDNSPQQVVVSGREEDLSRFAAHLAAREVRTLALPVRGAFHSPLMQDAVHRFREVLDRTPIGAGRHAVWSSTTAEPFDDVRKRLADALVHGVRWRELLLALHRDGARSFVDTGPGRVMTGLVRRTLPDAETHGAVDQVVA